ncbi:hypothetical protein BJ322DRAFT_1112249 [Thelephora terrestris]|uniref:Uncharacterized protein n=1 Tax=Thelephora terrestris TaxID=56493 RepID=A0A9P6H7D2_9AGAM|nr:hypothetical protein BJ322DRAFT_1112249 [Thelephora terrestris]
MAQCKHLTRNSLHQTHEDRSTALDGEPKLQFTSSPFTFTNSRQCIVVLALSRILKATIPLTNKPSFPHFKFFPTMSTKTLCRSRSILAFPTKADFQTEKELLKHYYENKDARLALLQAVRQEQGNTEAIVYFRHHLLHYPITIYPNTSEDYIEELFEYQLSILDPWSYI